MALRIAHPIREQGNTVPYPPLYDDVRRNYGFVDLRGRPELVANIPEVEHSVALGRILTRLAAPNSSIMTLGCDLGEHHERKRSIHRRRVSGGYLQICPLPLGPTQKERLIAVANDIENQLSLDVGTQHWEVELSLGLTAFLFEEKIESHSIWIWFFASGSTFEKAAQSRENLLGSLDIGLAESSFVHLANPPSSAPG